MLILAQIWTGSRRTGARLERDGNPFSAGMDGKLLMRLAKLLALVEYVTELAITGLASVEAKLMWFD